ncbi:TonB-dependent siderophore receptor [Actomonas aquatica]|uniref:TonB-dependent receptor n=1 Tax=Actomonas aquatica TaxID=2866162 RepID=A0ABZ1C852_9BACT|nr:TonB-dependent receptor [Opitutus sp. WL0086]WRQ87866.1 TonB-dependent receptor [Opitutus sp. WL0086]
MKPFFGLTALPRLSLAASLATLSCAHLPAQTEAADDEPTNEEVVTLKEFSVTATTPSEYGAAESTTGTRVASRIRDLPFSVNVVTGEFLDDFAAFEFREQFGYTSSVSVWETLSTGYNLRGFDADVQLRNGFRRIGLIDKVNVSRAEVIKGPAASIYGTVLPGGTINVITKKPEAKQKTQMTLYGGSDDMYRVRLSSTGPVKDSESWFYRIDAAHHANDYDQPFKHKEQRTVAAQLLWKPNSDTSFLMEYEWLERDEVAIASTSIPMLTEVADDPYREGRTYTRYTGLALDLMDFNPQGPLNYSDRYVHNVTATFEHRFNDIFSLRSSGNWFERGLERQEVGSRSRINSATGLMDRGTPRLRPYGEGGASWQTDLLASWESGSVSHKTLLTVDYQRQTETPERWDMTATAIANGGMPADVLGGLDPANPNYDFVTYREDPSLYALSQKEDNSLDLWGVFLSERMTLADERINLMAGVRYDYVDSHARDLRNNTDSRRNINETTYQLGGNWRVTPGLSLFASTSKSFVPQFGVGRAIDGSTYDLPNETGEGWEAGFKADMLEGRLTFTTTYFDIDRANVARDTFDLDTGATITVLSGAETSSGVEFDFNWVVTPSLQFFGGYGYVDAKYVSHAQAPHLEGIPLRRAPKDNLGVGVKYTVKNGTLKGLYFTGGYKYYGESLVNPSTGRRITASSSRPIQNLRLPNGRLIFADLPEGELIYSGEARVDDGRESIFNDSYGIFEAGVGYSWRTHERRYRHKVQLNVRNLSDEVYTYGSAGPGQGRSFTGTYDLSF